MLRVLLIVPAQPQPDRQSAAAQRLSFNITHTDGLIVLAIAQNRTLGVDAENFESRPVSTSLADSFFAPEEAAALRTVEQGRWQQRFFQYWTLKESYFKARGLGLALPLGLFTFHRTPGRAPTISFDPELHDDPATWQFAQFWPTNDHRMAVAVRRTGQDVPITVESVVPEVPA